MAETIKNYNETEIKPNCKSVDAHRDCCMRQVLAIVMNEKKLNLNIKTTNVAFNKYKNSALTKHTWEKTQQFQNIVSKYPRV